MKGKGLERDTLDGVIADLKKLEKYWRNGANQMNFATLRDALFYLQQYKDDRERPIEKRLIDVLREVRDEE